MELKQNDLVANLRKMHKQSKYYIKEWCMHYDEGEEYRIAQMIETIKADPKLSKQLSTKEAENLLKEVGYYD